MPKIKDYIPLTIKLLDYFGKNTGLNTVTGAIAPLAVMAGAQSEPIVELGTKLAGPEVAAMLAAGTPVGYVAAGLIVLARVLMAVKRSK